MFFMRNLTLKCFKTGKKTDENGWRCKLFHPEKNNNQRKQKQSVGTPKEKKNKKTKIYPPFYIIHHDDELKPDNSSPLLCYVFFFNLDIMVFLLTQNLQ